MAAGFNQLVEGHTPVAGFCLVFVNLISNQDLETLAGFVFDVFSD